MSFGTKTILIASDANVYMMYLKMLIRKMGFVVEQFHDEVRLMDTIGRGRPDMILLDKGISGLDCIKALKSLKKNARTANIPVAVVSGDASDVARQECLALGAESYLMKPVSIYEMHELLQRCLYLPIGYVRDHLRVYFSCRVMLRHEGGEEWCYSENLSERGLYVYRDEPLQSGTELEVSIPLYEERPLVIESRVLYGKSRISEAGEQSGMAIEFRDSDLDKLIVVSDYVRGLLTIPSLVNFRK